jgi:hypothetical protein
MNRRLWLIVLSLSSVALHVLLLASLPGDGTWVEAVYAGRIYPAIGPLVAFIPSLLPFSVISVIFLALAISVPAYVLANLVRFRRARLGGQQALERSALAIVVPLALLFHSFYMFWGYNYLRPPLEQRLGLVQADISSEQRSDFSLRFVAEAAAVRLPIDEWNPAALDALVDAAIAEALRLLESRSPPVVSPLKGDLNTGLLARTGTHGFIFGTTLEAHVDFGLPTYQLPFTAAHEKAHLAGFARERDANFIAWLALTGADDPRLRYAGYFGVVNYFLNVESRRFAGPILDDLAELRRYSAERVAPRVRRTGQRVYGTYLRANRMPSGTSDYSQVWQLIQVWTEQRR